MAMFSMPAMTFRRTETIGVPGVVHYGPRSRVEDEWHPNLRGPTAVKVYREMRDNDAIIGGAANIIEQMLRQVHWRVVASKSGTKQAQEAKLLVEQCMNDMDHTWSEFMSDVISMIWYGWASFEKVYKVRNDKNSRHDDNRIGWKGLYIRAQETLQQWQWDMENGDEVIGWWQQAWSSQNKPVFLPMEKLVHFRTTANRGSPEGRSYLRNAYRSWFFMKRMQEMEGVGFQRNLEGIPMIRLPLSMWENKEGKRAVFDRMVQLISRNEHQGLTFPAKETAEGKPTGYDLEIIKSAGGDAQRSIRETIRGLQREIGINFNTQFQQLGTDGVGSNALSSDQTNMFAVGLGALLMNIKDTLNRNPVDEVQELNGYAPEDRAHVEHSDIEKPDVERFASSMAKLSDAGLLQSDTNVRNYVRSLFTLPEEEDTLPEDDTGEDATDSEVLADELVSDDGADDSAPIQTAKIAVPTAVQDTAQRFLLQWRSMQKQKRTRSVVVLARAKMLSTGRVDPQLLDSMRRFFKTAKAPTQAQLLTTPWQYWEASGGDAAKAWLQGG